MEMITGIVVAIVYGAVAVGCAKSLEDEPPEDATVVGLLWPLYIVYMMSKLIFKSLQGMVSETFRW